MRLRLQAKPFSLSRVVVRAMYHTDAQSSSTLSKPNATDLPVGKLLPIVCMALVRPKARHAPPMTENTSSDSQFLRKMVMTFEQKRRYPALMQPDMLLFL